MTNNIIYTYTDEEEENTYNLCFNCAIHQAVVNKRRIDAYMITDEDAYNEYNMESYNCFQCQRNLV